MRQFDLIIFDWDGTLYRSIDLIQNSIIYAGKKVGRPIATEVARDIIGLGLRASQQVLFPDKKQSPEFLQKFHLAYREHYEAGDDTIELYAGAYELVRDLKMSGKTVAVATAKSRKGIDRVLVKTGLGDFVSHSRTPDECRAKPDPQMINEIIAEAQVARERTLMVGDTAHDLTMAQNAQVASIGITHGAHLAARLNPCKPLAVVANIAKLRAQILI